MIDCDCKERIGVEIDSYKIYEQLQQFFEEQVRRGIFVEIPVGTPYYIGTDDFGSTKWYADKWYRCRACGTLWEVVYPDFPAKGFIRKFENGKYKMRGK